MECDPITRAEDPNEIGVLDTVMAGAPGVSVVPATEMPFDTGLIE